MTETIAVPKMMMYVSNLLFLLYILYGIHWLIKNYREKREKKYVMAERRMENYGIKGTNKTFADMFEDITLRDRAKLFMHYEALRDKEQERRKKFIEKEEKNISGGIDI